jgi:hypothetical protein
MTEHLDHSFTHHYSTKNVVITVLASLCDVSWCFSPVEKPSLLMNELTDQRHQFPSESPNELAEALIDENGSTFLKGVTTVWRKGKRELTESADDTTERAD